MAQIAFGICLGPSALGSVWPEFWTYVFNDSIKTGLESIRIIAITIFCFITGLELKPRELIQHEGKKIYKEAIQIIIIPIILSSLFFILFFDNTIWHGENVPLWKFSWAMGVATCITAMPMLVISCKSLGIWGTHMSKKLLGIVAFDDLIVWFTVSVIVTLGQNIFESLIFGVIVITLYYFWPKIINYFGENSWPTLTVTLVLVLSYLGHWAHLHYLLGAFIAGVVTPKNVMKWNNGMEYQQMFWLMPVFFIWTGLKTEWTLNFDLVIIASMIMYLISFSTKFIGVWLAYRKNSISDICFKTSLLQNKGLMEILLANMLLGVNVISVNMFAAVVIMSLISTITAVPLAKLFFKEKYKCA